MLKRFLIAFLVLTSSIVFGQFGRNKVQYKNFDWYYIQTKHFDIYFTKEAPEVAEFTAKAAEDALNSIQSKINYRINNRITLILYYSQNDFQETNVIDVYLPEGVGGFTELFKNRVVVPFTGSYRDFRHVIHHELVHAVFNDMFYGGSIQNVISNNITIRFPMWFSEGMPEYLSLGWDIETDMFIRDAATSEYLPDINGLNGYFAYRGGQSVVNFIATKYGEEKIAEILHRIKGKGNVEEGMKAAIGLNFEELNERWKREVKKEYWPEISVRQYLDDFAKRLTDPKKDRAFFNTSPTLSPQGDKIAFISNRDIYFDVYLMDALDGKIIKRIIKGNRTADFEELNILTPGLSWSPDGKKIALGAKSKGYDVVYFIDVDKGKIDELAIKFEGVGTVSWSPSGKYLAIAGHNESQSDIYLYDLETKTLTNLTNDIFSDKQPSWSPDESKIFFVSDRGLNELNNGLLRNFDYDHSNDDIFYFDIEKKEVVQVTRTPDYDESFPVMAGERGELLYVSDESGINNIYKKRIQLIESDTISNIYQVPGQPITNSLTGINQLSLSKDGKKLAFSSMFSGSYNIFVMNNPYEPKTELDVLPLTPFRQRQKQVGEPVNIKHDTLGVDDVKIEIPIVETVAEDTVKRSRVEFFTGTYIDTTKGGDTTVSKSKRIVFGTDNFYSSDTTKTNREAFNLDNNLDSAGNYFVNRYKISFSPDIIYANAGFSTLYGLLGTTVLSFSDVLGNHRIIGMTSLQIDLKNSDYGVAYYYLPKRISYGVEFFHTARFLFLQRGNYDNLFRFRNYGLVGSASLPLDRFNRIDFGLSMLNVSSENLDNPSESSERITYLLPTISYVKDNTIFGYTAPIDGTRYRLDFLSNPFLQTKKYGFYSVLLDYRNYNRFWTDYSFAFRLSGGYSWGNNPQRFFMGGVDNWINRRFSNNTIPIDSPSDFAFLATALPMRGYDFAERIGTRYSLVNMELRFPFIRDLPTGALPILFTNVLGNVFLDLGTTWNNDKELQLFAKNNSGNVVTKDLLMGMGVGTRIYFLYFLLKFDLAWKYNIDSFSKPIFYFSLGTDF